MSKRILVTGLTGFVGKHLQALLSSDESQWALVEATTPLNLLDKSSLHDWCAQKPDAVIHLAGQTFVPQAFKDPEQTFNVNLIGTLNLLQALKDTGFSGTFLYVSSGDVYGQVDESSLPIVETHPVQPRNPYAVSKVAAELLCKQWSYVEPWRIVIARPFNHIGPGQNESFVTASIAKQLAAISQHKKTPQLEVGDVDVTRDFLDVRDVIRAYMCLLDKGVNGEVYNVCSGQQRRVRDLIDTMIELSGLEVNVCLDPSRMRKAEQRTVAGSPTKLTELTGWKPNISIKQTLQDMLQDWLKRD